MTSTFEGEFWEFILGKEPTMILIRPTILSIPESNIVKQKKDKKIDFYGRTHSKTVWNMDFFSIDVRVESKTHV